MVIAIELMLARHDWGHGAGELIHMQGVLAKGDGVGFGREMVKGGDNVAHEGHLH